MVHCVFVGRNIYADICCQWHQVTSYLSDSSNCGDKKASGQNLVRLTAKPDLLRFICSTNPI